MEISQNMREKFFMLGATGIMALLVFFIGLRIYGSWSQGRAYASQDGMQGYSYSQPVSDGYCNIAVIPVAGDIVMFEGDSSYASGDTQPPTVSGDWVASYVRSAQADPSIKGILLQIDSYGGSAAASELIMNTLRRSGLPSVALIREAGTSGGYLSALGADTIIASPFSDIGSIGVTYSYLDNVQQNAKEGLHFNELASGPFKDSGNPNKPLSDADIALYKRDLRIFKELFVSAVAERRNLPQGAVEKLADGSAMPGELALQNKLIDALGDEETARQWLADKIGSEAVLCQ